jgi:hypothetical protein
MGAAAATGGFLTSQFGYDRIGRQTSQSDFQSGTSGAVFSRTATYAENGQLLTDAVSTKKSTGTTYTTNSTYAYTSAGGEYLLGAVASVSADNALIGQSDRQLSPHTGVQGRGW